MVKRNRIKKGSSLRYFFLNGQHHKCLRISRSEDILVAWNYSEGKRVTYIWSVAKRDIGRAFTVKMVSNIFQRDRLIIHDYIKNGKIKRPAQTYSLDGEKRPGKFLFSEDDLRDLHSYLLTVHRGRPRKDGQITQSKVMSRAELEALMREDTVLYTKDSTGEFVPVWKQPDW
jgi:hypothetical protein